MPGVLLTAELLQLGHVELALERWRPFQLISGRTGATLPASVAVRALPLEWDQKLRCAFTSCGIISVGALVALQTPLAFGVSSLRLASASVIAEGAVGLFVYADLFVLALYRLRPGAELLRGAEIRGPHIYTP